jgi:hypothetical protein
MSIGRDDTPHGIGPRTEILLLYLPARRESDQVSHGPIRTFEHAQSAHPANLFTQVGNLKVTG